MSLWKKLKKAFKVTRKPQWKYLEGVHFLLMPDIEAAKRNDPNPWNIKFLGRIVKVHSIKLPELGPGQLHVDINAEVLYGDPYSYEESQQFGDLLMELVQRNYLEMQRD